MLKYFTILLLSLCACGGSKITNARVLDTHCMRLQNEISPVQQSSIPIDIELSYGKHFLAMRCSDQLNCLEKLNGECHNGYNGHEFLTGANDQVVGVLYHCITDEEKAALDREAVEEKVEEAQRAEWDKLRAARNAAALKKAQEELQTPAKK